LGGEEGSGWLRESPSAGDALEGKGDGEIAILSEGIGELWGNVRESGLSFVTAVGLRVRRLGWGGMVTASKRESPNLVIGSGECLGDRQSQSRR
jgi:hypothetical protein